MYQVGQMMLRAAKNNLERHRVPARNSKLRIVGISTQEQFMAVKIGLERLRATSGNTKKSRATKSC